MIDLGAIVARAGQREQLEDRAPVGIVIRERDALVVPRERHVRALRVARELDRVRGPADGLHADLDRHLAHHAAACIDATALRRSARGNARGVARAVNRADCSERVRAYAARLASSARATREPVGRDSASQMNCPASINRSRSTPVSMPQ